MNHEFIKYDVYLLWVLIYWFKLVKVCQARTAQGPIRCFKMLRFLEEQGEQSKKSVLLRHERANADARTCWLYSNLLATESGLFINPLTWSSHLHVAHVVLQFIWGDSTFARIELHLSHNDMMQQVWWFKITYEAECKAGFDDHQLVFAFHGHFIMCTQSTIPSSFSNRIRVEKLMEP